MHAGPLRYTGGNAPAQEQGGLVAIKNQYNKVVALLYPHCGRNPHRRVGGLLSDPANDCFPA